ncbi:MAG: hypothetical protein ACQEVA_04570 [Myxococcota bacterium]
MSDVDDIEVELRQGNETVRRLVEAALEEEGFSFTDAGSSDLADVLVVDVDSSIEVEDVVEAYAEAGKAVLVSGLRRSREHLDGIDFIERPFSMSSLVHAIRKACDLDISEGGEEDSEIESPHEDLFMEEEPEDLSDSGPTTREMEDDEAGRLEEELGLQSGQLRDSSELAAFQEDSEIEGVVEIDSADSIVLDVDDLEEIGAGSGGTVRGEVAVRAVDIEALQQEAEQLEPPPALSKSTASQTMPDAPAVKREGRRDTQADDVSGVGSSPQQQRPTTGLSKRRRSSHGAGAGLPEPFVEALSLTSDLIAKHWNAVSLAARPSDRAERIERVILAALRDGPSAAEDELRRIPVQDGFSGSLGSWGLRDVLMVLIFRRLRGRLEVSVDESDYVLFIDRGELDEIENLAGDNDRLLLDILRRNEVIPDELYDQLDAELDKELSAPLEMKLRSSSMVESEDIQEAKRDRARELFAELVASGDTGWFAFMQVGEQGGHSWPVNPLELGLDALMSRNARGDGGDESEGGAARKRELPSLTEDSDQATREVPGFGPEPADAIGPAPEDETDDSDTGFSAGSDSHSFQGETRESAPWEIAVPSEAEAPEAGDAPEVGRASSEGKGDTSVASDSDEVDRGGGETVESGATDISLPDEADEFFGDSRELDDLLKSVIEDSDAEVD